MSRTPRIVLGGMVVGLGLCMGSQASAQIPDTFTNLQVLDKGIGKRALIGEMRQFAGALGVRCNYCHVGEDPNSLQGYDFASDEKPEKVAARTMMQMTATINADPIAKLKTQHTDRVTVQCVTCHRGQARPRLIEEVLEEAREQGGISALALEYRQLRERYYGRHTFDFSESVLSNMAQEVAAGDDLDSAAQLLELNLEFYPEDAMTYLLLGRIAAEQKQKDVAVGYFEKAIEYQPDERRKESIRQLMQRVLADL